MLSFIRNATTSGIASSKEWHVLENLRSDKVQNDPPTDEQLLCVLQSPV